MHINITHFASIFTATYFRCSWVLVSNTNGRRSRVYSINYTRVRTDLLLFDRSAGGKIVEADGSPLVDTEALKGMIRLLRLVQPLYKGQLERFLLNLCAHHETRASLVQILMEMLLLDTRKRADLANSDAEPSYWLCACQNYVMYSCPQFLDGVPPLVSRRILETLYYLAKNLPCVAKLLLQLKMPLPLQQELSGSDQRGKTIMLMDVDEDIITRKEHNGTVAIILLFESLESAIILEEYSTS